MFLRGLVFSVCVRAIFILFFLTAPVLILKFLLDILSGQYVGIC